MITITPAAAKQIKESAQQSGIEGASLRLAAKRSPDGGIDYGMGFEEHEKDSDLTFKSSGVNLVVEPGSVELLKNAVLDYVELEPGEHRFIFMNPNDPNYRPPDGLNAPPIKD
ncbi:HesB/IscA family protein [Thioalkalivibrio paradoxus]|uniref:Adhesin n=1 Tax=Thioalkalivibrio paradoxus ARh 1 TaxID=713585 RepID=W0DPD6_9GAMM|nr:iron-sulfur cluster assembly accessory protein [Thioalkalivibrio paradoxus]AHE98863.1 adhesin [Thioalkalivibrio paradoxus ARh 1]